MRQALKSLLALLVAATVMMVIRAYVFTIYTVPVRLDDNVGKGDRVGVLHWLCSSPDRGDHRTHKGDARRQHNGERNKIPNTGAMLQTLQEHRLPYLPDRHRAWRDAHSETRGAGQGLEAVLTA